MIEEGMEFNINGTDFLVCDVREYEGKVYANLMSNNGKLNYDFYEITKNGENFKFNLVENEELINNLIKTTVIEDY